MGCIWLFVLHTRFNRAFRSVFRFVSDNFSDIFCIVCTQTAFFIEKHEALGDFHTPEYNFSGNLFVVCTGPKNKNGRPKSRSICMCCSQNSSCVLFCGTRRRDSGGSSRRRSTQPSRRHRRRCCCCCVAAALLLLCCCCCVTLIIGVCVASRRCRFTVVIPVDIRQTPLLGKRVRVVLVLRTPRREKAAAAAAATAATTLHRRAAAVGADSP